MIEPVPSLPPWLEEYQWIDFVEKPYHVALEALVAILTPPNPIQDLLDQQVQAYLQTGELIGEAILRVIDEARETLEINEEAKELIEKSLTVIEERQRREQQLLEESERYTQQIILLNKIGRNLTSSLDLSTILNQVLEYAIEIVRCQAGTLFIVDEKTGELIFEYVKGPLADDLIGERILPRSGYVGQVVETRRPMIVNGARETEAWPQAINEQSEFKPRDLIVIPMIVKDRIVGVIQVINRIDGLPFNKNDQDLLTVFSDQAAIAIDNSKLFEELQRSNLELMLAYDATIEGWSRALELRDRDTEGHSVRVTEMTLRLAQRMGLGGGELVHIRRGALLHDIGKLAIPDAILLKPGELTLSERKLLELHPEFSRDLLWAIEFLRPAIDIPYCHHEKWDGSGYPRGLKGKEIPLNARIFSIVNVYDNLASDRPYRKAWSRERALDYIREQSGKHFDPEIAKIFLNMMENLS
jgi:HD-GYP domain-containing protein (c-di-GMP phosphodiesterase class II)